MKRTIFAIVVMFMCIPKGNSQTQTEIVPKVGVPPEVATLGKFQNVQVGIYTGVPDISIPLHIIKCNGLDIPITLQYHSSGIKVGEEASWVGLGWNLSPSGAITMLPQGTQDSADSFFTDGTYQNLVNGYRPGFNAFNGKTTRGYEGIPAFTNDMDRSIVNYLLYHQFCKPDIYFYNIPGQSGQFYFNPDTGLPTINGCKKSQIFIDGTKGKSHNFTLHDMTGNSYQFNISDITESLVFPTRDFDMGGAGVGSSTWWLNNIQLTSGRSVNFSYCDGKSTTSTITETYCRNYLLNNNKPAGEDSQTLDYSTNNTKYLTGIETDNEKIEFVLSTTSAERQDLQGEMMTSGSYSAKRLNQINIIDKFQNRIIKSYRFNYSYFTSGSTTPVSDGLRLKLDSISEIATSGDSRTIYKFDYNNTYPLPSKKSYAVDFWGYYNGRTANSGLIPKLTSSILSGMVNISNMTDDAILDFYNKGNANRGTDPTYVSSGMLNKITYPTGGYTTLNFESNTFSNWGSLSAAEIDMGNTNYYKNINVYDFKTCSNTAPKRSQLFCPDHNGLLTLMNVTNHIEIIRVTGGDPSREYNYYSKAYIRLMKKDINNNVSELQRWSIQNPVSFTPTTPYNMQYGKLEYQMNATDSCYMECSLGDDVPCSNGMPGNGSASSSFSIINDKATTTNNIYYGGGLRIASQESYDKNNIMTSKRNYTYSDNNDHTTGILMSPVRFHSFKRVINMDLTTSYLLSGAYLFSISSNSYTPLSYAANGAVVGYNRVAVSDINLSNQNNGKTVYYYRNKPSIEGSADKGGVPDLPYEDNGLEDSICYYNRDSQMVRKIINSYGIIDEQLSCGVCAMDTYVGEEYNQLNTNVINFVQQRFVLTFYPIQTRWYALQQARDFSYFPAGSSNATITCKNQTYNTFGQCISQTIANSDGNSRKTQYIYPANDITSYPLTSSMTDKYLYNNILQENVFKNESNLISQKTWGYIVTPTGNIKTQSLTQSYPGNSPYDIISEVKYDIRDNVIQSKQHEQYTVYLWSYNYQYPVARIEGLSYTDLTNNYYSQSLIDQLAQTALPTQSQINAIRAALTNVSAMVSTYTYDPLIGIATITDPKGVTTTYNYDTFNRLMNTKNHEENLLSKYLYHYYNQ